MKPTKDEVADLCWPDGDHTPSTWTQRKYVEPVKLIIAGGRDFIGMEKNFNMLEALNTVINIVEVVSGCARGADRFGESWAEFQDIPITKFPAKWDQFGRSAGHIRNRQMAKYADAVVLFPGGKGTMNMKEQAEKYNITIYDWR